MCAREGEADALQQRLLAVVAASGALLRSPQLDDVPAALLRVARELLAADGYAVWRFGKNRVWQIRECVGVSEAFAKQGVPALNESGPPAVPPSDPLVFEDVFASTLLEDRLAAYAEEGVRSLLSIPLGAGDAAPARLVLYYRTPHHFTDVEIETSRALGSIAAAALATAELHAEQLQAREHSGFLAQASAALADSLDFETTLSTVARLAVPAVADSCAIHLIDEAGAIRLVAAVHVDPLKASAMETLADPRTSGPSRAWLRAITEGTSALLADITTETVQASLQADERLKRVFDEVSFTSQISVPLRARGRTIGGVTFALGPGTRRYDENDLRRAEDLAHRAAIAVDNARLYRAAQENEAAAARGQSRARFLADVGAALASSLDYERTLKAVANLAVPGIADWCAVDILNEQGTVQRLAVAHVDPEKVHLAAELEARYPEDPKRPSSVREVIRTGRPTIVAEIADELIVAAAATTRTCVCCARSG